jgi:hypothetical protein
MKNIFMLMFLFCTPLVIWAADTSAVSAADAGGNTTGVVVTNYTVYDVYEQEDIASNVLIGWGGISFVSGAVMLLDGNEFSRGLGIQNVIWGAGEAGFGLWEKNTVNTRKSTLDEFKEKTNLQSMLITKTWIDVGLMAVGAAMLTFGNESVRGHGSGLLVQGFFLFSFDGINYIMSRNLSDRYKEPAK